ncbi:MAG: putative Ig domain-containing protein [Oscillospiraceae bacterium]|nr:putative Ig domain-containing protein [Oscillospiraceae bacterium]
MRINKTSVPVPGFGAAMKKVRRLLAFALAFSVVLALLPGIAPRARAAGPQEEPVEIILRDGAAMSGTSGPGWVSPGEYMGSDDIHPLIINDNGSYHIKGARGATYRDIFISVESGLTNVNITLENVSIDVTEYCARAGGWQSVSALDIAGSRVNLELIGSNSLKNSGSMACVHVPAGAYLDIGGEGSLDAANISAASYLYANPDGQSSITPGGAGIGGSANPGADGENAGYISINSGTIKATGSINGGAGIGGGGAAVYPAAKAACSGGDSGTVVIDGGYIIAAGGLCAAGIGGGGVCGAAGAAARPDAGNGGNGGSVTVSGGTVNATGGLCGAGIGGGGSQYAHVDSEQNAGGYGGRGAKVTIAAGLVTATGQSGGAGIGGGAGIEGGSGNAVTISGGAVKSTSGGSYGAGIGGGGSFGYYNGLKARGSTGPALARGGEGGDGGRIIISGGDVEAQGGGQGSEIKSAAIGGGGGDSWSCSGGDGGYIRIYGEGTRLNLPGEGSPVGNARYPRGRYLCDVFVAILRENICPGFGTTLKLKAAIETGDAVVFGDFVVLSGLPDEYCDRATLAVFRESASAAGALSDRFSLALSKRGLAQSFSLGQAGICEHEFLNDSGFSVATAEEGWTYTGQTLSIEQSGEYIIRMSDVGASTLHNIKVSPGVTADITLDSISANCAKRGACAFDMTGAKVNLTLIGDSVLISGGDNAGLQAPSGSVLRIEGEGSIAAYGSGGNAGIGGGDSGSIYIAGGTVIAEGSAGPLGAGAGIGGGAGGSGGRILIFGENTSVTANGSGSARDIGAGENCPDTSRDRIFAAVPQGNLRNYTGEIGNPVSISTDPKTRDDVTVYTFSGPICLSPFWGAPVFAFLVYMPDGEAEGGFAEPVCFSLDGYESVYKSPYELMAPDAAVNLYGQDLLQNGADYLDENDRELTQEGTNYLDENGNQYNESSASVDHSRQMQPEIATRSLPPGGLGEVYSQTLETAGGERVTWRIDRGRLPAGLWLNSRTGVITGTPVSLGTSDFTLRATSSAGYGTMSFTIDICAPPAGKIRIDGTDLTFDGRSRNRRAAAGKHLFRNGQQVSVADVEGWRGEEVKVEYHVSGSPIDAGSHDEWRIYNGPVTLGHDSANYVYIKLTGARSGLTSYIFADNLVCYGEVSLLTPFVYHTKFSGDKTALVLPGGNMIVGAKNGARPMAAGVDYCVEYPEPGSQEGFGEASAIVISGAYLDELPAGNHTLTFEYAPPGFSGQGAGGAGGLPAFELYLVVSKAASLVVLKADTEDEKTTLAAEAYGGGLLPTGTVEFFDGEVSLGASPLSAGTAAIAANLEPGSHDLKLVYSGDSHYAAYEDSIPGYDTAVVNARAPFIPEQPSGGAAAYNEPHILAAGAISPDGGTLTYQWYKNSLIVYGATQAQYEPDVTELGSATYHVVVTNVLDDNGDGGKKTASSESCRVALDVRYEALGGSIEVSGDCSVGSLLRVDTSRVTGGKEPLTYQWQAGGEDVAGANDELYLLRKEDAGKTISCTVARPDAAGELVAVMPRPVGYVIRVVTVGNLPGETTRGPFALTDSLHGEEALFSYGLYDRSGTEIFDNNMIHFTGASGLIPTGQIGGGLFRYTINSEDVVDGVITITATYVHTNLQTRTLAFPDGNRILEYDPETTISSEAEISAGSGEIEYASSNENVAVIDGDGNVTLTGSGTATITAVIGEDEEYAGATASYVLHVIKAPQDAPPGVSGTNASYWGNDGLLSGVTAAMEYKGEMDAKYMPVTGAAVTGLSPGYYRVRYAADANHFAGADVEILIKAYGKQEPGSAEGAIGGTSYIRN